jgi:hypothetical protein
MILDVLAWLIIWVFIAFAILPCIFDNDKGYKEALVISFMVQGVLLAMFMLFFSAVWAVIRVTNQL